MKREINKEVNSGPNGIAHDNAWNTYNQSAAKYKEDIAPYYSNYRDFNQAQAAVLNNITGTYKIISENQMQNIKSYQDAVNKEYSYKLKQSEINFCDLNPKIKSESDRAFCHSLFQ